MFVPGRSASLRLRARLYSLPPRNGVSTRNMNLCGTQWLAYVLLYRHFAAAFAGDRARIGTIPYRSAVLRRDRIIVPFKKPWESPDLSGLS
jgi:hypothetical protein